MARVLKRVARKDYPNNGIKKGDTYYKVSIKTGPRSSRTMRQLTPFKRSQLTTSDYLSRAYDLADDVIPAISAPEDLDSLKESVEELKSDQEEKLENMPEGLKEAPTGQMLQERIEECDNFINHLDGIEFDSEDEWNEKEHEEHETYEDYVQTIIEEIQSDCPF